MIGLMYHYIVPETFLEAANIRGVGDKMADKIAEILNSGRLQKVEEICNNEKAEALSLFNRGKHK